MDVMEGLDLLPGHGIACTRQDCRELLDQVWPIACLLELLNHADHDIIIDALSVDFVVCGSAWRRWWGVFVGDAAAALGSIGK